MVAELLTVAGAAALLAADLPANLVRGLTQEIAARGNGWTAARHDLTQITPQAHYREAISRFVVACRLQSPAISADAAVLALIAAHAALDVSRRRQPTLVDLIWSGPDVAQIPPCRAEQALLQVIDNAQQSLLIAGLAIFRAPEITRALARAAIRGVRVQIVLEDAEPRAGRVALEGLHCLGPEVAAQATVYVRPHELRGTDANGRPAAFTARCGLADETLLFVAGANVTGDAGDPGVTLGVLIAGGHPPGQIARQFAGMVEKGELIQVC